MSLLVPFLLLLIPLAIMTWIIWDWNRKPKIRLNPQVGQPELKKPDEGKNT